MNLRIVDDTRFGPVVVAWTTKSGEPTIIRVLLSAPEVRADEQAGTLFPEARPGSCAAIDGVAASMTAFLGGAPIDFSHALAELGACPRFQRRVLRAEHSIPRGRVSTYGLIAAHLGAPHAARAVGNALAANPFPLIVPCHRAVRADGRLGGYQGGPAMKRALLEMEGICLDAAGRVASGSRHYSVA